MCGIVALNTNTKIVKQTLLDSLSIMEYRGYDSAGMTLKSDDTLKTIKAVGKVVNLSNKANEYDDSEIEIGIAHTRWATHGGVNERNSHPHVSFDGNFSLVHNGIINNYLELKQEFFTNQEFNSQTDSELVVQLIAMFYQENNDILTAIKKTIELLQGSFALAIIHNASNEVYLAKRKSPLLIGKSKHGFIASSDINVINKYSDEYIDMDDDTIISFSKDTINYLQGEAKVFEILDEQHQIVSKNGFDHFMMKEIFDQEFIVEKQIEKYITQENEAFEQFNQAINQADKLVFVASGTSYHAALLGARYFTLMKQKRVEVLNASEFTYEDAYIYEENTKYIFISQSGETADSIACINKLKRMNQSCLLITNSRLSTMQRLCELTINVLAGVEISVASTKAFTAQSMLLYILAGYDKNKVQMSELLAKFNDSLMNILSKDNLAKVDEKVKEVFQNQEHAFYLGRNFDYTICLESSLKLKEISYIHVEAYAAGELKHGPISLICENMPVVAYITQDLELGFHTRSNLQEVATRGANVVVVASSNVANDNDDFIFDHVDKMLNPILANIYGQLIGYYAALHRGYDIDQPRNLAKSVTVE